LVKAKPQTTSGFPKVVTSLPEAEIQFEGAKAWIHQAKATQLVFFQFESSMNLPEHSHSYSQWGIVIEGEMEMTIAGKLQVFRKGDEYLIPSGVTHPAKFFFEDTGDGSVLRKKQIRT
jgi:quercetin dioxygenase-like cupin family protein